MGSVVPVRGVDRNEQETTMQASSKSIPETPRSRLWRQISRAMQAYLKQSDTQ